MVLVDESFTSGEAALVEESYESSNILMVLDVLMVVSG